MKRHHRGKLRHGKEHLGGGKGKKDADQQPARACSAQVPGHGQVDAEGPKQQPRVLPRGISIKAGCLPPKKIAGQSQRQARAPGTRSRGKAPALPAGQDGGKSDEKQSGRRKPRIPPTSEEDLSQTKARCQ